MAPGDATSQEFNRGETCSPASHCRNMGRRQRAEPESFCQCYPSSFASLYAATLCCRADGFPAVLEKPKVQETHRGHQPGTWLDACTNLEARKHNLNCSHRPPTSHPNNSPHTAISSDCFCLYPPKKRRISVSSLISSPSWSCHLQLRLQEKQRRLSGTSRRRAKTPVVKIHQPTRRAGDGEFEGVSALTFPVPSLNTSSQREHLKS